MENITIEYINEVIASMPALKQKLDQLRKEFPSKYDTYRSEFQ